MSMLAPSLLATSLSGAGVPASIVGWEEGWESDGHTSRLCPLPSRAPMMCFPRLTRLEVVLASPRPAPTLHARSRTCCHWWQGPGPSSGLTA